MSKNIQEIQHNNNNNHNTQSNNNNNNTKHNNNNNIRNNNVNTKGRIKKNYEILDICQNMSPLPTYYPSVDKNKFGQVLLFSTLPTYP